MIWDKRYPLTPPEVEMSQNRWGCEQGHSVMVHTFQSWYAHGTNYKVHTFHACPKEIILWAQWKNVIEASKDTVLVQKNCGHAWIVFTLLFAPYSYHTNKFAPWLKSTYHSMTEGISLFIHSPILQYLHFLEELENALCLISNYIIAFTYFSTSWLPTIGRRRFLAHFED